MIETRIRKTTAAILLPCFFLLNICSPFAQLAHALPQGAQVAAGSATISQPSASTLQINQGSDRAIINWNQYSIAANEAVRYYQPNPNSIALNRVTGTDPSLLFGQLQANGQVWVINPNGLLVGPNARVNVGSFLASTLDIGNEDFMAGRYSFKGLASSLAAITNQGLIKAADNGYVVLSAPSVTNEGKIIANLGRVNLASTSGYSLNFTEGGLIGLIVDEKTAVDALGIINTGRITADGGQITLSARAASDALKSVVNNSGVIQARSIGEHNGVIRLDGGESGAVTVSGILDASGRRAGETGGKITLLGDMIGLVGNASLIASGAAGGGEVLVGGNYQGKGPEQNASAVYMGKDATIYANATKKGAGGRVILWSNGYTGFYGNILARGAGGGNGGFVETSSHDNLQATGRVDASSPGGKSGMWLLDPRDITITNSTSNGAFDNGNPNIFTPTADNATVLNSTINASLDSGTNVTITTGSTGAQSGDITVASSLTKSAGTDATLTLLAANSILVSPGVQITSTSNKLNVVLNADSDTSGAGRIDLDTGITISTNGGNITLGGGANPLTGYAVGTGTVGKDLFGIFLRGTTLDSGAGNISLRGKGFDGTSNAYGIYGLTGSVIKSTSGNITIDGKGGSGTDGNIGVLLYGPGTLVQSQSGAISITGQGAGTGSANYGIQIGSGAKVASTGSAIIALNGAGAAGTSSNYGVFLSDPGTQISSVDGAVTITGAGGNGTGQSNAGIYSYNGVAITSTGTGAINLNGTGGSDASASGSASYAIGIWLDVNSMLQAVSGAINLNGVGGSSTNSATSQNHGVLLGSNSRVISQDGAIAITGQANGAGFRNRGIDLESGATVASTGAATITLNGTGALGTSENSGVYLAGANTKVTSQSGAIGITGQGAGSSSRNYGFALVSDAGVTSAGNASINITGRGVGALAPGIYTSGGTNNRIGWDGASAVPSGDVSLNATATSNSAMSFANTTIRTSGTINLNSTGSVAGNVALSSSALSLLGAGGNYTLTNAANAVGKLAANTGTINYSQAGSLAIDTVNGIDGVTASNTALIRTTAATADITLNRSVTTGAAGDSLVLAAGRNFINNAGATPMNLASGRYLVYSTDPSNNTFGGFASTGNAFGRTYAADPPGQASIASLGGNRMVYSVSPTLTVSADPKSITYGDANPGLTYTVSGLVTGDTAGSAVSGALSTTATQGGNAGTYDITQGNLAALLGYKLSYTSAKLTIAPAKLTINADPKTKTIGNPDPPLTYTASGFVLAQTANGVLTGSLIRANGENAGSYTINQGGLASNPNYTITFIANTFTITPPITPPTIPPNPSGLTGGTVPTGLPPLLPPVTIDTPLISINGSGATNTDTGSSATSDSNNRKDNGTAHTPFLGDNDNAIPTGTIGPTITLRATVDDESTRILGNVEAFKLLVNDSEPILPKGDVRIVNESSDEVIRVKGNHLDQPMEFLVDVSSPENIASYSLMIANMKGDVLHVGHYKHAPGKVIAWNGMTNRNEPIKDGEIYQYWIELVYINGSYVKSPVRLFVLQQGNSLVRSVILDQHRQAPVANINQSPVAIDSLGRYAKTLKGTTERIEIEMGDRQGRFVKSSLEMPGMTLTRPAGGVAYIPKHDPVWLNGKSKKSEKKISYKFAGKTTKNSQLSFNGTDVPMESDGTFSLNLELMEGVETYWMHVRTSDGVGKLFRINVSVDGSGKNIKQAAADPVEDNHAAISGDTDTSVDANYTESYGTPRLIDSTDETQTVLAGTETPPAVAPAAQQVAVPKQTQVAIHAPTSGSATHPIKEISINTLKGVEPGQTPIRPADKTIQSSAPPALPGKYTIMVGEYTTEKDMSGTVLRITALGMKADIKPGPKRKVQMIRLSAGEYKNRQEAEIALVKLRSARIDGIVLRGEDQKYRILIGSYADQANAKNEQAQLAVKGIKASLKKHLVPLPTRLLTAGSFATREEASKSAARLEYLGVRTALMEM